jgi:hypothetical protein
LSAAKPPAPHLGERDIVAKPIPSSIIRLRAANGIADNGQPSPRVPR